MDRYIILNKSVGQTPLDVLEAYKNTHPELTNVPLAYAGRLDPMASGKLLVLIGEECKKQEEYHHLDKEYVVEILLGVSSDTGDVLGLLNPGTPLIIDTLTFQKALEGFVGEVALPYPHFSSKTVAGKPLHTWKAEGRIDEITIPTAYSRIYSLTLLSLETKTAQEVYGYATQKIETIPPITDMRKALGNDFRRVDVRASWKQFIEHMSPEQNYSVAKIRCICSSGTYMRTLAGCVGEKLNTKGLALSIHRTRIGKYQKLPLGFGFWSTSL